MAVTTKLDKVQEFKDRLEQLYEIVRSYAHANGLNVNECITSRSEQTLGQYKITELSLSGEDTKVLFKPFGIVIIAAEGRVDVVGKKTTQKVVYLAEGGPAITTKLSIRGEAAESSTRKLYPDVGEAGWYWVHERPSRKTVPLSEEMLQELLSAAG